MRRGIFRGPPKFPTRCRSVYEGFAFCWPENENGRASHAELPPRTATPPLYSERWPGRLFPNARSCANGEAALLFTLPLITNPSAAPMPRSPLASSGKPRASLVVTADAVVDGFTPARRKPLWGRGPAAVPFAALVVIGLSVFAAAPLTGVGRPRVISSNGSNVSSQVEGGVSATMVTSRWS